MQVDRLGSEVAWRHADQILAELEPDVALMRVCTPSLSPLSQSLGPVLLNLYVVQDVAACQASSFALLQGVADSVAPFSLDYTPSLLEQYMQLFCSSIRLQLLARALPSKLIWQLYSLVYSYTRIKAGSSQDQEVPDKEPLLHAVASFDTVIPKLQADYLGLCPRIGQVCFVVNL